MSNEPNIVQLAAPLATEVLGEHIGAAVEVVLLDHADEDDPNICELAHRIVVAHFRKIGVAEVAGHRVRRFFDPATSSFYGEVVDMPGCFVAGATYGEFEESVTEAVQLYTSGGDAA